MTYPPAALTWGYDPSSDVDDLGNTIFAALQRMDSEANVHREEYPTGLAWYGGYYRPELKRPQTEPSWTHRLGELLPEYGFVTRTEVAYPALPRCKCDLVVTLDGGRHVWIEVKGAWKEYWIQSGGIWIYRSYLLHPLVAGLDAKTHTVPLDLERLRTLKPSEADHLMCVLVGFDSVERPMDADVAELVQLAGLAVPPWRQLDRTWTDPYRTGGRVCCWTWSAKVSC